MKVLAPENGPCQFTGFQSILIYVSRPLMVIETFLTVQNVQNGHVYIDVVKQHIPQNAYFQRKSPITDFQPIALHQSRFLAIFSKTKRFRVYVAS